MWCWNTIGKPNGEKPISSRVGCKVLQQTVIRMTHGSWKLSRWPPWYPNQIQLSITAIWAFNWLQLGVLEKVKLKTSLKTETGRLFLVSQLTLLQTSRPTFSTAEPNDENVRSNVSFYFLWHPPVPRLGVGGDYCLQPGVLPGNSRPAEAARALPDTLRPSPRVCHSPSVSTPAN